MIVHQCELLWINGNDCEWLEMIVNECKLLIVNERKWLLKNVNDC